MAGYRARADRTLSDRVLAAFKGYLRGLEAVTALAGTVHAAYSAYVDEERLARIEAQLAIQQLAIRYAIGIDSRDLDLLVEQWVPDVWMGKRFGQGREAVRAFFTPILQGFYRTTHMIVGHMIDLVDADNANGQVYCRAEHESGDDWVVQAIVYGDTYRRVDGRWGFAKRQHHHWYSTPIQEAPAAPTFENWPRRTGAMPDAPHHWPSWQKFWLAAGPAVVADVTAAPDQP